VPWLPIYRKVTVICPLASEITTLNRAEAQRKAFSRLEWGIGMLLVGTALSGALKAYGGQAIGAGIAAIGVGIAVHAVIVAQMYEHWWVAGIAALVIVCGCVAVLLRNKGFTLPKIGKFRKR